MTSNTINRRRLELIDTSVLLEILGTQFESDRAESVKSEWDAKAARNTIFRIPMATVMETGSHIRKMAVTDDGAELRKKCAERFVKFLRMGLSNEKPWSFEKLDWNQEFIESIVDGTQHGYTLERSIGDGVFEIGDLAIVSEWQRIRHNVSSRLWDVDVWTLDATLRGVIDGLRG